MLTADELINLCTGKRMEVLRKRKREKLSHMRAQLPSLTREEVIRSRLPPHKSLARAVSQEGFPNTAEYMLQLINYQEYIREYHGPTKINWLRPRLIHNIHVLHHLRDILQTAERAHTAGKIAAEILELLKLGVEYAFGDENWWWLGHQILSQALDISMTYRRDGGMHQAMARYAFGKFLLQKLSDEDGALVHLSVARNMSVGMSWVAKSIFGAEQQSVYTEVCILIFDLFIKQARRCMRTDFHRAIKLAQMAKKAAADGCYFVGVTEAIIVRGQCEESLHNTEKAIIIFQGGLFNQRIHEDPKGKCELLSNLAIAYLKHGRLSAALETLHELKDFAEAHQLLFYVAQSYKYLGEYYLKEGSSHSATPLLRTALNIFTALNNIAEMESTRNYAAIAIGIELINHYILLLVSCSKKNPKYESRMQLLLDWKDFRSSFWKDIDRDVSFVNFEEIVTKNDEEILLSSDQNNSGLNQEIVLSVLSLERSNESTNTKKNLRSISKNGTFVDDSGIHQTEQREGNINVDPMLPKLSDDELSELSFSNANENKELVLLHLSKNYETRR